MKLRSGSWWAGLALALASQNLPAQFTNDMAEQIPPLNPPHAEIPPTFWEQHSGLVLALGALSFLVLVALVWIFTRPHKPPVLPLPARQARNELDALRRQPEDGGTLSLVSQILRRYITTVLKLPPVEMTTSDFCGALSKDSRLGPELRDNLAGFLKECDERKFAPPKPAPAIEAVPRALALIDAVEACRQPSLQPVALSSPESTPAAGSPTG